jgi:hypothetical protein
MKNVLKVLSEYAWLIFFLLAFFVGIFFIIWMGNSKIEVVPPPVPQVEIIKADLAQVEPIDKPTTPMADKEEVETTEVLEVSETPSEETKINNEELVEEESELCPTLLIKRGNKVMLFNKNMPEVVGENPIFFDNLEQYILYSKKQKELYNQNCPVLFLQEEVNAQGEEIYKLRQTENTNVDPLMLSSVEDYFKNHSNVVPKFKPPSGPTAFNGPPPNSSISLSNFGASIDDMKEMEMQKQQPLVPYKDANRDNPPYNQGFYGFDPTSQYVGKYTVIDEIHNSTKYKNKDGLSSNPMDPNWGGAVFTAEKVAQGEFGGNNSDSFSAM